MLTLLLYLYLLLPGPGPQVAVQEFTFKPRKGHYRRLGYTSGFL